MKQLSLVIFDMDGLMFDTERLAFSAWKKAGKDFGFEITPNLYTKTIGSDFRDVQLIYNNHFGKSFPYHEIRKTEIQYTEEYIEQNGVPVKKGLYQLINFLEEKSILRAVATSTERERAEKYLSLANIKDKFDLIVCGDDVLRGKPEPDIFLKAAERLNCLPNECIVLEDSENGLKAAATAGMYPVYIPDLNRPSKEVQKLIYREFDSLIEVKKFIKNEINIIAKK